LRHFVALDVGMHGRAFGNVSDGHEDARRILSEVAVKAVLGRPTVTAQPRNLRDT